MYCTSAPGATLQHEQSTCSCQTDESPSWKSYNVVLEEEEGEGYRPHFSGTVPLPPDRSGQGRCDKVKMKNTRSKKRSRPEGLCEIRKVRVIENLVKNRGNNQLQLPGLWWWWWWLCWVQGSKSPPELSVCSSAALFSEHGACLSAGADMLPSAGALPAGTLTTPGMKWRKTGDVQKI